MRKSYIALALLAGIIGLMMLFAPADWIKVTVIILGIAAVLNGFYNLKTVKALVADPVFEKLILIRGIGSIAIGLCAVLLPVIIAGIIWTVMIYVLAVFLLFSAGSGFYALTRMKEAGIETKMYLYEIVFSAGAAVLLFIMPAQIGLVLVRILGVVIFVLAAVFIFREWKNNPA